MSKDQSKLIVFSEKLLKLAPSLAGKKCAGMIGEPKLPEKVKKA